MVATPFLLPNIGQYALETADRSEGQVDACGILHQRHWQNLPATLPHPKWESRDYSSGPRTTAPITFTTKYSIKTDWLCRSEYYFLFGNVSICLNKEDDHSQRLPTLRHEASMNFTTCEGIYDPKQPATAIIPLATLPASSPNHRYEYSAVRSAPAQKPYPTPVALYTCFCHDIGKSFGTQAYDGNRRR